MNTEDIENWVFEWVAANTDLSAEEARARKAENAFAAGILDSMKFIFFVTAAESEFGIRFSQEDFDFTKGRFASLGGLCDLIRGHLG